MTESPHLSRNEFVKTVVGIVGTTMAAVIGLPAIGYILSPALKLKSSEAWIPVGKLESYPVGTPTLFSFTRSKVNGWEKTTNSYGVYVYRESETETAAFSNVCTHLSCRVLWHEDVKEYVCPCHDAHFEITGEVASGPPPRPLDTYETKVEEGNLFVHFVEG
jgi:menaquinol-cytochrome c reductase iron-sulfur subunit